MPSRFSWYLILSLPRRTRSCTFKCVWISTWSTRTLLTFQSSPKLSGVGTPLQERLGPVAASCSINIRGKIRKVIHPYPSNIMRTSIVCMAAHNAPILEWINLLLAFGKPSPWHSHRSSATPANLTTFWTLKKTNEIFLQVFSSK